MKNEILFSMKIEECSDKIEAIIESFCNQSSREAHRKAAERIVEEMKKVEIDWSVIYTEANRMSFTEFKNWYTNVYNIK